MITYYKFLNADRTSPHYGMQWPEPGEWLPEKSGHDAAHGYSLARPEDLVRWLAAELWEVEAGNVVVEHDSKVTTNTARLVRRVEAWTPQMAAEFARWCADRVAHLLGAADADAAYAARAAATYAVTAVTAAADSATYAAAASRAADTYAAYASRAADSAAYAARAATYAAAASRAADSAAYAAHAARHAAATYADAAERRAQADKLRELLGITRKETEA